jgi:hypothetical protein
MEGHQRRDNVTRIDATDERPPFITGYPRGK